MGVGKSTVGSKLASRLGRPFIDLDREVERAAGQSINGIFDSAGEATFRRLEQEALAAVIQTGEPAVVALGGGTCLDESVRQRVRTIGPLLTLHVPAAVISKRIQGDESRPLLREQSIEAIVAERSAAYRDVDWVIDAASENTDEVVEAVEAVLNQGLAS